LVIHGSINENIGDRPGIVDGVPVAGGTYYTSKELKHFYPNLKVILHGHIHHETAITKSLEGVWLINPGSMLRTTSAEENRRIPKVAYIDTETEAFQLHPIAIAQPYESVFNLEAKAIRKSAEFEIATFLTMVSSTTLTGIDVNGIIRDMLLTLSPEDQTIIKADLVTQGFTLEDLVA